MKIKKITNQKEIYNVMMDLKDSFFSEESKKENFILNISAKFAEYAEFYVAYENESVLGFVSFYCNDLESKLAFVSMIIVDNKSQGFGLGSKLLEKTIEVCKEKGIKSIMLEVNKKNKKAISFYEKKSFKLNKSVENSLFYQLDLKF